MSARLPARPPAWGPGHVGLGLADASHSVGLVEKEARIAKEKELGIYKEHKVGSRSGPGTRRPLTGRNSSVERSSLAQDQGRADSGSGVLQTHFPAGLWLHRAWTCHSALGGAPLRTAPHRGHSFSLMPWGSLTDAP